MCCPGKLRYTIGMDSNASQAEPHASWTIAEYPSYDRDRVWYIVASLLAVIKVGVSIWYENYTFAVLVLVIAIIVLVRHYEEPPELLVEVHGDGVQIGQQFFPYLDMSTFAVVYDPPEVKMVYFNFASQWRPRLPVPLGDESPVELRRVLLQYLEEDGERVSEPTSEWLSRRFRL